MKMIVEAKKRKQELAKKQPAAFELEQTVLGAILIDKDAFMVVADILHVKVFYPERHQIIYKAILNLYEKSWPIDVLTVAEELKRLGCLSQVGNLAYISELTMKVASSANIEFHSRIIIQKYLRRQLGQLSGKLAKDHSDNSKDVFDILEQIGEDVFSIHQSVFTKQYSTMAQLGVQSRKQREEVLLNGKKDGLPSGFTKFDKKIRGFHPSDFTILAGRPGMGKTSAAICIALNNAKIGNPVGLFSLEMSGLQLYNRMLSIESEIEGEKIALSNYDDVQAQTMVQIEESLTELPIFIDDTGGLSLTEFRVKARRMVKNKGVKLIIVDYLQLMSHDLKKGNREQEISIISRGIKALAKELNIPIIALSQLSRAVETRGGDKRPLLSDLRESGSLEQDTDMVIFAYRAEYYQIFEDEEGNSLKGKAELIVSKNRHGALDTIQLGFKAKYTKFTDEDAIDGEFTNFEEVTEEDNFSSFQQQVASMNNNNIVTRQSKINDDEDIPF